MTTPTPLRLPVPGGSLHALSWGSAAAPTAIAVHGITANAMYWGLVGEELAAHGVRLVAPDLRGRGHSDALGPSSSIGRHADDVWLLADLLGLDRAVVVGHSMGGFVVATAAARHPERTAAVVLVDGGPPFSTHVPPEDQVETVLEAVIGPALRRIDRTFADQAAYRDFWADHPGLAAGTPRWLIDAYADRDLVEGSGGWRPRVVREAVLADARDTLVDAEVLGAVAHLGSPATMLVAERGMLDDPSPLYDEDRVADAITSSPGLSVHRVPATNHYTIGTAPAGARAVGRAVARALGVVTTDPARAQPGATA